MTHGEILLVDFGMPFLKCKSPSTRSFSALSDCKSLPHTIFTYCRTAKAVHTQFQCVVGIQMPIFMRFLPIVRLQSPSIRNFSALSDCKSLSTCSFAALSKAKRAFIRNLSALSQCKSPSACSFSTWSDGKSRFSCKTRTRVFARYKARRCV